MQARKFYATKNPHMKVSWNCYHTNVINRYKNTDYLIEFGRNEWKKFTIDSNTMKELTFCETIWNSQIYKL